MLTRNNKASESNVLLGRAGLFLGPTGRYVRIWMRGVVGSNSPRPYQEEILPACGCTRSRGMSSGMSRRQGWKPAVILAPWPEESKGQNTCSNCCVASKRFGKDRKGFQRFRRPKCGRTVRGRHDSFVRGTYVSIERAESVLRLLVEGNPIGSIESISNRHLLCTSPNTTSAALT